MTSMKIVVVHLEEACQLHALQPVHGQSVLRCRYLVHVPHKGIRLQLALEEDLDSSRLRRNSAGLQYLRNCSDQRGRHRQADLLVVEHCLGRHLLISTVQSTHHGHTSRRVHLIRLAVAEDQEWVSLQLLTLKLVRGLQVRIDHGEVCLAFLRSRAGHILIVVLLLQQRAALTLSSLHSWCGCWRHSWCCSRHRSWCHSRRWSATTAATTTAATEAAAATTAPVAAATARRTLRSQARLQLNIAMLLDTLHAALRMALLDTASRFQAYCNFGLLDGILDRIRLHSQHKPKQC